MNQNTDIINFQRISQSITANKKTIFFLSLIFIALGIFLYLVLPKKYTSEAEILIKKTGSTNLSYINPFVVSENAENDGLKNIFSTRSQISEEIEIIKSSLVIENVVKENNLKYIRGHAKGKYLSTKDFLRKYFNISKIKDTNIIYISYKSKNPVLSYSVINSIISNYKKVQKNINLEKSSKDADFLKIACLKAEKELNHKIEQLKKIRKHSGNTGLSQDISMLGFFDKRVKNKLEQISNEEINIKNLELEISQKSGEVSSLREKLETSSLIKQMSNNATDILILEAPKIREKYDFSEPQPLVIIILCLLGWVLACLSFVKI